MKIDKKIVGYSVSTDEKPEVEEKKPIAKKKKRPEILFGSRLKIKANGYNIYVNISCDQDGRPLEIFLNSSHLDSYEWVALATRLSSMILRSNDPQIANMDTLANEFIKTETPNRIFGKVYGNKKGKSYNGVIQLIGYNLLALSRKGLLRPKETPALIEDQEEPQNASLGVCDKCGSDNLQLMDGCPTCRDCGDSKCS